MKFRLPLFVVLLLLTSIQLGCSGSRSQSETDARDKLSEIGGIAGLDANQVHIASMMFTSAKPNENIDEAVALLADLPYLGHLELTGLNVTDEHMKTLTKLSRLNSVVLSQTQIGDEGAKLLSKLSKLDTLYIDETNITPVTMAVLAKQSKLKILDISGLDMTDHLEPLLALENLDWLLFKNSTINTAAADNIAKLPKLSRLSIQGSKISPEDLDRIKSAKPSLTIDLHDAEAASPTDESADASTAITP